MQEPLLEGLSPSARAALEWADASALLRGHGATVDGLDVLAGVAVAHPADSRPDQLLGHFGLPLGAVLAGHYPAPFDAAGLTAARAHARTAPPETGGDVEALLSAARSVAAGGGDGTVHLGALFGALLETGPAATAIGDALREQGADPDRVRAAYRAYLASPNHPPLPEYLAREVPWDGPPEIRLPEYLADDPGPSRPTPGERVPDDLVGIGPQVDAFAYLAASVNLEPPLAVGLFGDWGSGKSFFMRALQRRIDALTNHPAAADRPAGELPFFRRVAQVEFNAWHYVDGDLWASLVEHLFQNLRVRADEGPAELADRRERLMGLMRETATDADAAALAIPGLTRALDDARTAADRAARDLEERRRDLPGAVAAVALEGVRDQVEAAMRVAGVGGVVEDVQQARAGLDDARDALRRGGRVLAPFRTGLGWLWLTLAVLAVVVIPVAVTAVLDRFADEIAAAVGGVASVAGVVAMVARTAAAAANRAADTVERTRDRLEARVADAAAAAETTSTAVADAERRLRDAVAERERLEARRAELERQASALAGTVLGEFIEASAASDELRAHLGVPAIIRRRLEALSALIAGNNAEVLRGGGDPEQVNRIVLYVDDLDRCPADHVIRVLQAVHLLLAFPLFVVVVAVDKRWLAGSLARHYGPLLAASPDGDRATPDDYVEKIFQVPFQVPPLDTPARTRLLHGLLPAAGGPAGAARADARAPEDADVARLVAEFFERPAVPAWLRRADLRVTPAELAFIDRVVPLLDDTPRSVKRFANVFLLVKSIAANSGRPFRGDAAPADHESVILLLALGMGHPRAARRVHAAIADDETVALAAAVGADAAVLAPVAAWGARPVGDLAGWADLCRRFTFTV